MLNPAITAKEQSVYDYAALNERNNPVWKELPEDMLNRIVNTAGENAVQILRHTHCVCGASNITTTLNVGSDISEDGEEAQHIDRCNDCGSWRFNMDVWDFANEAPLIAHKYFGKWNKQGDTGYEFINQLPV